MSDFNVSVGTCTFCVDNSLGDTLAGKVSKFIEQMEVLDEDGSAWASGH